MHEDPVLLGWFGGAAHFATSPKPQSTYGDLTKKGTQIVGSPCSKDLNRDLNKLTPHFANPKP